MILKTIVAAAIRTISSPHQVIMGSGGAGAGVGVGADIGVGGGVDGDGGADIGSGAAADSEAVYFTVPICWSWEK